MTKPKRERANPDAFMPFFVAEYVVDTMDLSVAEHGAYCLLLIHHWRKQGAIRGDDASLMAVTKTSPQQWRAMRDKILAFFKPGPTEGTLVQKRLMVEVEIARANKDEASARGKAGAEARHGVKPDAGASQTGHKAGANETLKASSPGSPLPLPSTSPQNSLNTNSGSAREDFSRIVKAYPVRKGDPIPSTEVFWLDLCAAGKAPPIEPLLEAVAAYAAHLRKTPTEPVVFLRKFIGERWGAWLPDERPKSDVVAAHTSDWGDACGDAVASFKHSISPAHWACFFAHARWDAGAKQLQFASRFECEYVASKWGDALLRAFGEPFAIRHMPVRSVA